MKIFSGKRRRIVESAADVETDLIKKLDDALDPDTMIQMVDLAISEGANFDEYQFMPKEIFFDTELSNKEPHEIAEAFFFGEDLDSNKNFADPTRDFFRFNKKGNVESTDYPGDIYLYEDDLADRVIEYIIDNIGDLEFPDNVQEIVNAYLVEEA